MAVHSSLVAWCTLEIGARLEATLSFDPASMEASYMSAELMSARFKDGHALPRVLPLSPALKSEATLLLLLKGLLSKKSFTSYQ